MRKLKSVWPTLTGSVSSVAPVLFACCKSTACIGVCASPLASVFGITTAGISGSPLMSALEPLLIAISAVSFTVSYYTLYVLPKLNSCNTNNDCACVQTAGKRRKERVSKSIFWIGLIASIIFLSYFECQKYNNAKSSSLEQNQVAGCCPDNATTELTADSTSCGNAASCCDTSSTSQ